MNSSGYGPGQRQCAGEAPACVQNAMMTKDKKPFTYTPGGIDLSQIKSERMAKRLARNAQAEGATGASQQNRPQQPHSPSGCSAAATIGAAGMGMPFQVLPPPPPPPPMGAGKTMNGSAAPPPPPPSSSSNTSTLAPPLTGGARAPGSPSAARKSPTPQRFEPPPIGFRPEIKIPPNPMASLRKVEPPVEKNTFWKDEYVKERSKSPMCGENNDRATSPHNGAGYNETDCGNDEGYKKPAPTTTQKPETNNNNNNANQYNQQQPQAQQPQQQHQQYQQPQQYNSPPPQAPAPAVGQQQTSPRPEFRSVAAPQSPSVNVYTRQTGSPHSDGADSAFRYPQQQQQQLQGPQQQPRSPLAQTQPQQQQQSSPSAAAAQGSGTGSAQAQTVPWRTQRIQQPQSQQQQQPQQQQQTQPKQSQPIFNNVQQQHSQYQPQPQQQQQRSPEQTYGTQNQPTQFQGPKPTNVGSLYIAPLAAPVEPQAQHIVRQQMQQQQQQRDSPMRQVPPQQQQQPPQQQQRQPTARWMNSQAPAKEQPAWARPEENGNVVPSSLNRIKSPPPPAVVSVQLQYQPPTMQGGNNGFAPMPSVQNFGAQVNAPTGLRLQVTTASNSSNGPKERIIPIQLEQTPTYTPNQPSFNAQAPYGVGNGNNAPAGYVIRSPNQFVDQGYNNFPQQQQQQRIMSPTQQLNAPRIIQQVGGAKTHIVPITVEGGVGTRGPISNTPIVIQNDLRSPPVQSKSFRILQKITDTVDHPSANGTPAISKNENIVEGEPQLQRPQFARQMSAQQARNSPTIEQMRRMQIAHDQQSTWNQDASKQHVHPSEQQVPEPKKYTGSAIPSRSFKILQAMTTPENAGPGQSDL